MEINGSSYRIFLQNENGPCALLALCNVLLLSPQHSRQARELIEFAKARSEVTLNQVVTILANIGMRIPQGAYSDLNQLLQILPQLHTGLNINPIFNGSFEDGDEMSLFRLFNVSIVHGWLAAYDQDPVQYQHVSKYSYEEAQRVLVEAYDMQQGNLQTSNAQEILEDANYIKSFLARSATQLTEYGLKHLKDVLLENSYAVLFRNDHFSTLIKNNGELYLLVTDSGFKNNKDIIWQSLKSVNGSQDTFYTGNFIPATLQKSTTQLTSNTAASTHHTNPFLDPRDSTSGAQQDRDSRYMTDEELARHLQEEEDARVARSMQRGYGRSRSNNDEEGANGRSKKKSKDKSGSSRKRDKLKKSCIIM